MIKCIVFVNSCELGKCDKTENASEYSQIRWSFKYNNNDKYKFTPKVTVSVMQS